MVPVGRVGPATIVGSMQGRPGAAAAPDTAPPQRALVPVVPAGPARSFPARPADGRPNAPFLAHLIATSQGAPQTRERRRADPNWAITTYAAAMQVRQAAGREIRESR